MNNQVVALSFFACFFSFSYFCACDDSTSLRCSSYSSCQECVKDCVWCSFEEKCTDQNSWYNLEIPCAGAIFSQSPQHCRSATEKGVTEQEKNLFSITLLQPITGSKLSSNSLVEFSIRVLENTANALVFLLISLRDPNGHVNEQNLSFVELHHRVWLHLEILGAYELTLRIYSEDKPVSAATTAIFDHVPSLQLERGVFSSKQHPGFPTTSLVANWLLKANQHIDAYKNIINHTHTHSKIPRIIHQIWTHGKQDLLKMEREHGEDPARLDICESDLREHSNKPYFLEFTRTWKATHPDWEHRLWTSESMLELVKQEFPFFLQVYKGFKQEIKRIDAIRYLILFRFGGVIIDIDFENFKDITPLINDTFICLGREPWDEKDKGNPKTDKFRQLATGWIASTKGHPFWWYVINEVIRRAELQLAHRQLLGVIRATGPQLLEDCAREYHNFFPDSNLKVLSNEIYPIWPGDKDRMNRDQCCVRQRSCAAIYKEAYAVHHYSGSWYDQYVKELEMERINYSHA